MPHDLSARKADVDLIRSVFAVRPKVAVVAGSGLGGLSDLVEDAVSVPYEHLAGWPPVTPIAGHAGRLVLGQIGDTPVMVFDGRVHLYQGASAPDVAYPARLAAGAGAETLVLTNASGGIAENLRAGDIVLIADHLNLTGTSPLVGWPGFEGGVPFVPMGEAWDSGLRQIAVEEADKLGMQLPQVVYAGVVGPSYETPAEVRMLRNLGADIVGMSTVTEAIAARALNLKLLGLSLVTNTAGGSGLSHEEVLEAGKAAEQRLSALVVAILHRLSGI